MSCGMVDHVTCHVGGHDVSCGIAYHVMLDCIWWHVECIWCHICLKMVVWSDQTFVQLLRLCDISVWLPAWFYLPVWRRFCILDCCVLRDVPWWWITFNVIWDGMSWMACDTIWDGMSCDISCWRSWYVMWNGVSCDIRLYLAGCAMMMDCM